MEVEKSQLSFTFNCFKAKKLISQYVNISTEH
jgi:hypothetical protein